MARFDVYKYSSKAAPLVVDVQADLLDTLNTRVVVPLVLETKAGKEALPRLKPIITVSGKKYVLMATDIAALPKRSLGAFVTNIEDNHRQDIVESLDFLLQGF